MSEAPRNSSGDRTFYCSQCMQNERQQHKLQQCLSGGVQAFSMAHRPSFTPALMRDVIMQVGHFPCRPQGGKLSQLTPPAV